MAIEKRLNSAVSYGRSCGINLTPVIFVVTKLLTAIVAAALRRVLVMVLFE